MVKVNKVIKPLTLNTFDVYSLLTSNDKSINLITFNNSIHTTNSLYSNTIFI